MSTAHLAYFFALSAAVLFSGASVIFAKYSVSHSPLWINFAKAAISGCAFFLVSAVVLATGVETLANLKALSFLAFFLSGFVGLAVGDYFLFRGYERIGSARTIMVFSFSPLFLTLEGYFFFHQGLSWNQLIALFFLVGCAWTLSFEKFRERGHWEWQGILFAVVGVFLDNVGIVLSRYAFDLSPGMGAFSANAIRSVGALVPLYFALRMRRQRFLPTFRRLPLRKKRSVVLASFLGTFLSLSCWLTALRFGHIGSLAGVSSFNPVAASIWEWILLRKRPTVYLVVAMALFLVGFTLLLI